jgi:hypothetical protein
MRSDRHYFPSITESKRKRKSDNEAKKSYDPTWEKEDTR